MTVRLMGLRDAPAAAGPLSGRRGMQRPALHGPIDCRLREVWMQTAGHGRSMSVEPPGIGARLDPLIPVIPIERGRSPNGCNRRCILLDLPVISRSQRFMLVLTKVL